MKIISISDFHGSVDLLDKLLIKIKSEKPDLIVFSGDLVKGGARGSEWLTAAAQGRTPSPDKDEIKDEKSSEIESYKLFYSCLDQLGVPVCVVPGNMDAPEERYFNMTNLFGREYKNFHLVHQGVWENEGFSVMGFGGEITDKEKENYFVLQYPKMEFENFWTKFIGYKTDKIKIFILHIPPVSKLDLINGGHKGSNAVNQMIEKLKPDFIFCGHAHDAQGHESFGGTLGINPGTLKKSNMAIVETDSKKVDFVKI